MTKPTRYFLIGSVVVVAAGLATGLVAYYNGGLTFRSSSEPAEFSYLPAGSAAVAYADVRAVMDSNFRQRLRQVLPTGDEQERLRAEIGVDIERDIDTVVASFVADGGPAGGGAVVLVRGRFNEATIEAKAVEHGGVVESYKGKRIITMGGPADAVASASGGCVAFLESGLLALGDVASVKRAIDTRTSGDDVTKSADLMKIVNELQGSGNAWVVGRLDGLTKAEDLPAPVRDQLGAVQLFAARLHIDGGVSGLLRAEARDDQAAEQLRDVVRGVLAAGRLVSGADTRVEAVLNSFQLQGTGRTVTLSFSVPAEVFDIVNGLAALGGLAEQPRKTPGGK